MTRAGPSVRVGQKDRGEIDPKFLGRSFLWGRGWRKRNRNPLPIPQDGFGGSELKPAFSVREIQPAIVRIAVCPFDHEPVQITRETRYKSESYRRAFEIEVAHSFEAGLGRVLSKFDDTPGLETDAAKLIEMRELSDILRGCVIGRTRSTHWAQVGRPTMPS